MSAKTSWDRFILIGNVEFHGFSPIIICVPTYVLFISVLFQFHLYIYRQLFFMRWYSTQVGTGCYTLWKP